jgi:hypothetical protein
LNTRTQLNTYLEPVSVDHRYSNQPFLDAGKQVEVTDSEIRGVRGVWDSSAAQARHLVTRELELATRVIACRTLVKPNEWMENMIYEAC